MKLIFPHRTTDDLAEEELEMCLSVAIECRARVIEQLAVQAPGEFKSPHFPRQLPLTGAKP